MTELNTETRIFLLQKKLTPTEVRTCELMLKFDYQQNVADEMFIHVKSVKFHLGNIYRKLEVRNQHGLLLLLLPMCLAQTHCPHCKLEKESQKQFQATL